MNFKKFLEKKGISEADFKEKSVEEMTQLYNEFNDEARKELEKKIDSRLTKKDLEETLKDLPESDVFKKFREELKEATQKVAQMEEKTSNNSLLKNVEKYQLRKAVEEKHEEIVKAIKEKRPFRLSFKAAEMHMTNNGTVTNGTGVNYPSTDNFAVDDEIALIRYPENFILNVIPNKQVSKVPSSRIRKEQKPTEGAAAVTAEGAVKPLVQYKFVRTTTDRVKYAGRIEWTEEFEMDFEALYNAILSMFEQDVVRKWQDGILDQISTNATSYVSSTLDATLKAPDNGLAIVAGQSQLQSLNYNPNVAIINPADLVTTMFQQDENGNLRISPYINVATGTINGMKLVQSNKVTQGKVLIGERTLYKEEHSDFILRTGQYGNQLIENEYTAIGEVFSILQIAEKDFVGWLELDLATVKTSLLKPAS